MRKLEGVEKEFENKLKSVETQLIKFKEVIEGKDLKISVLENKLKEMENKFKEFTLNEDKKRKKKKCFECPLCDFVAVSEKGLRTHKTRIHTDSNTFTLDQFPKTCDLCDHVTKNKNELKLHLKTHSYKAVNFKCTECEYFCNTELEMEVHIGKKHTDKFDCGMCGNEAKSLENLKIHLSTCEMYQCDQCEKRLPTLKEIKTHIEKQHNVIKEYIGVIHLKQNRSDNEVIDENSHPAKELFPDFVRK